MATATNDKPLRLGDLPVVKTNILENARQYDKGVVGGYSGTFPLTAASQGGIYLLPSTGKFYVCETAYNGAQISAPNSNFVELSVWKNHDRLSNLITSDNKSCNIAFKKINWFSEEGSKKPVQCQIGMPYKQFLNLSITSGNGKIPLSYKIEDQIITLGVYEEHWLNFENAGFGEIFVILEV